MTERLPARASEPALSVAVVLGAGTMGHGIAQVLARAGCPVRLYDPDSRALDRALQRMRASLDAFCELNLLDLEEAAACLGRVGRYRDLERACAGAGWVIEAAPEEIELKRELLGRVEELVDERAILCTNTSALAISSVARDLARPQRLVGTHFWNPAQVIPCVEVIKGEKTAEEVFELVVAWLKRLGKKPVKVLQDVPGFLGNRLQHALQREVFHLLESGIAGVEDIDHVVKYGFGLRLAIMGPLERMDLGGLDVTYRVQQYLLPELDRRVEPSPLLREKVEAGQTGIKSGQGFYTWAQGERERVVKERDRMLLRLLKLVERHGD